MSYNYKTRPHALYMHKDGIKSRVTTLIHRPLTRSASPSIWQYFCNITVAPGAAYWSSKSFLITFNAQLVNVFGISFPCASHHPAALCMFRSYLLVSVIAVFVCNYFLHAHYYKSCVWKCQCKVCASYNIRLPEAIWGIFMSRKII